MAEARFFHIQKGLGFQRMEGLPEALAAVERGGYLWLDYVNPARADLEAAASPLDLHPLTIEDCLDDDQIPKLEHFPKHTFIIFNEYEYRDRRLTLAEVDFLVGDRFLLTISGLGTGRRGFEGLEAMAGRFRESAEQGPDFLLHLILDRIVDDKLMAFREIENDLETAEEEMLRSIAGFRLESLLPLRHALLSLRKSLFHEREILMKLCRGDSPCLTAGTIPHFRDVYDHMVKYFETCEMNREILTSLMEMYLSLVNNRMAAVANVTNANVRRLTLITTVLMPLSLISGIGGMSEWTMITGPEHWRLAYPLLLAGMALLGFGTYRLLKWIELKDLRRSRLS